MTSNASAMRMTQLHFALIAKNSIVKDVKEDTRRERQQSLIHLSLLMMDGRWFLVHQLSPIHQVLLQLDPIIALYIHNSKSTHSAIKMVTLFVHNVELIFTMDTVSLHWRMLLHSSKMKSFQNWIRLFIFLSLLSSFPSFPSFPFPFFFSLSSFPTNHNDKWIKVRETRTNWRINQEESKGIRRDWCECREM